MSRALLALAAAAALLVCARADSQTGNFSPKMFPSILRDNTFNTQRERESQNVLANEPKEIVYSALKDGTLHKLFPHEDKVLSSQIQKASVPQNLLTNDHQANTYKQKDTVSQKTLPSERQDKAYSAGKQELPRGCLYEGRWHSEGAAVSTREDCLRCTCARGALACSRRACAPLPHPLPPRCHVRHRRGLCCPELHCPDGVKLMEHGAMARFERVEAETEAEFPTATPASASNACVEGGSVFAAGSALGSSVACEQCFCLRGARQCVRPRCLPPPPHCAPRPAPGACCPQRYYCDTSGRPDQHRNHFDCQVDGKLVTEGSPVPTRSNCSACFCLRGEVRCQALGCAPALAGCRPLLAPGDCCANQYVCDHDDPDDEPATSSLRSASVKLGASTTVIWTLLILNEHLSPAITGPESSPASMRYNERTFHSSKSSKVESTTKKIITSLYTLKHTSFVSATKNHLITTTKVKRKTDEPSISSSEEKTQTTNTTSTNTTTTQKPSTAAKLMSIIDYDEEIDEDDEVESENTTEQPEGTVKIVINGTINCTAELSSTSLPLSISANDTERIQMEAMPRVPILNVEAQTYSPNDIITDRNVNGGFDEDDTFTINVTSSLITNTSHSTSRPIATGPKLTIPADLSEALNSSKKKKGEYDYDYTEPTLPPSLPNLKIIPFVAADAVVDNEPAKDTITYPILEREDKFPVYYPTADTKDATFPNRREDTYQPTQYPVFVLGKVEPSYPPITHKVDLTGDRYSERNDLGVQEYTVSASFGGHGADMKAVTKVPTTSTTFAIETPAVNKFSPPVETEGGFIPKGSGVVDEYFAVYSSTPPGPAIPDLTTSMQLSGHKDIGGECIATDGRHVPGGQSVVMGCQLCTCSWVELVCERRPCPPRPGCRRLPPTNQSRDPCCGDFDCHAGNHTSAGVSVEKDNKQNETKIDIHNDTAESAAVVPLSNKTNSDQKENVADNSTTFSNDTSESDHTTTTTTTTTMTTTTAAAPTSTSTKPPPKLMTMSTPAPKKQEDDSSHEDDEEEDDDDFSFGSVLKLLLSDSYETTTVSTKKPAGRVPTRSSPPAVPPVRNPSLSELPPVRNPSLSELPNIGLATSRPEPESFFKPVPHHNYEFLPQINTVNRIDHLVLGEATAIKRTTQRPITNKTTKRPAPPTYATTERRQVIVQEDPVPFTSVANGGPRPPSLGALPGVGPGLLKLAGCNIYGRMYRVGRIITELSTPCQECWCTELGVQCKPLDC